VIHRPDSSPNAVKAALTVAEADMNADVLFEKGKGEGVDTPGQKFSFSIQMSETHVLLRSSSPRFATEASGLSIPFPSDHTRPIWLEGKEGTNMLVLLPTTKECGVRSVALCPRTYDGRGSLVLCAQRGTRKAYGERARFHGRAGAGSLVQREHGSQHGNHYLQAPYSTDITAAFYADNVAVGRNRGEPARLRHV